ncbi:MAG: LysR family transcriptional regulator [Geminicoccus sp.]|nr:LysR family transcriptional regulator [Geminicoccus sp.]
MLANELVETFLDLTKTLNFNHSAERLNVSQSTVSSRIRVLEEQLGTPLFTRGRSGARLTPSGERFQAHAHELYNAWARAMRDVSEAEGFEASLHVSAQLSLLDTLIFDLIEAYDRRTPRISLKLEVDYSTQIMRDLSAGEIDIGILFSPAWSPDLYIEPLSSMSFRMVSTETSVLEDVRKESYIYASYSPLFERFHRDLHPELTRGALTVGYEGLSIELLRRRGGSAYLPESQIAGLQRQLPGLMAVEDAPLIQQPLYLAAHVRRRHRPLVAGGLKTIRDLAGRDPGGSTPATGSAP